MGEPTFDSAEGSPRSGPVIRDRRRLDPETGQVREAEHLAEPIENEPAPAGQPESASADSGPADSVETGETAALDGILADLDAAQASAAERLSDLQRLQAEFVNYRRRVDRDRDVARDQAVHGVLEALLPVLDDVHLARQHGDLESGPFAAIAEKLDSVLQRFGLSSYGEPGEAFDPAVHEALMHTEAELAEGTTTTTVVQVLQPGYRAGDRVLRAARVAVADPH
jgi:molecular chaperone GrpE